MITERGENGHNGFYDRLNAHNSVVRDRINGIEIGNGLVSFQTIVTAEAPKLNGSNGGFKESAPHEKKNPVSIVPIDGVNWKEDADLVSGIVVLHDEDGEPSRVLVKGLHYAHIVLSDSGKPTLWLRGGVDRYDLSDTVRVRKNDSLTFVFPPVEGELLNDGKRIREFHGIQITTKDGIRQIDGVMGYPMRGEESFEEAAQMALRLEKTRLRRRGF